MTCLLVRLHSVGLIVLLSSLLLQAHADSYQVKAHAQGMEPPCFGMELIVLSATQTPQDLWFRVGVRNVTNQAYTASRPLRADDIKLTTFGQGKRIETTPTTITLSDLFPTGPLRAGEVHSGILTFPWGTNRMATEALGTMELRVPGFAPAYVQLTPQQTFTPMDWASCPKLARLNIDVTPKIDQLAIITMRLHSMTVRDDALEFTLSFRNAHRLPITWTGVLNGRKADLITDHFEMLHPTEVSESLQNGIAPNSKTWQPGEDNLGWIRFPLPHPQASARLGFTLPGYGVTYIAYDAATREWKPATTDSPAATATSPRINAVLDEERTFTQLKTFWDTASRELKQHAWTSFLKHFRGTALEDQKLFIKHWQNSPISSSEFRLSELQSVKPSSDGRLRSLRVELRYTLASLPAENVFITSSECDMQRDSEGVWHVDFINYNELQPFWLLGYTETVNTEHFLIFHRPDEANAKQASLAATQLEKGYSRLLRTGLTLKPRYAAFSIAQKNDFEKLTGRDPLTFSGGASSAYIFRKGGVDVVNQALYLNDFRFFTCNEPGESRIVR